MKDLRHLVINNIPKLTDTSLSWIANGCYNILTFSFKGTSITKPGAKAVRDKFPFSEMIFNDNFCGYWPIPRIDDRKLLNHYYVMRKGIIAMQGRARKLVAYKVAAGQSEDISLNSIDPSIVSHAHIIDYTHFQFYLMQDTRRNYAEKGQHGKYYLAFEYILPRRELVIVDGGGLVYTGRPAKLLLYS